MLVWCHCVSDVLTLWSGLLFLSPRVCSQHGSSSNIGGPACLYMCVCVCKQRAGIVLTYRVFIEGNWLYCLLVEAPRPRRKIFSYMHARCLIASSTPQLAPPITHTVFPVRAVASPASWASSVWTLQDPSDCPRRLKVCFSDSSY